MLKTNGTIQKAVGQWCPDPGAPKYNETTDMFLVNLAFLLGMAPDLDEAEALLDQNLRLYDQLYAFAMDIAYVLNKQYAPYYKWKKKGLEKSGTMQEIVWICEELSLISCQKKAWDNKKYSSLKINTDDRCIVLLETLARVILEKLQDRNLVKGTDVFLENYIGQVLGEEKS